MKKVEGFWLPDSEFHLVGMLKTGPRYKGGPTYQYHKLKPAIQVIPPKRRRVAVDVGAHCGLWSRVLVHEFETVHAFEPVEAHRQCFVRNVPQKNVILYPYALGDDEKIVHLHTGPSSSGDTYVKEHGEHKAEMRRLDSFRTLENIDFLKIDCEGYEYYVLLGGEHLIRTSKPWVIVEQKPNKGVNFGLPDMAACDLLKSWGAKELWNYSGDYCFGWK